MSLGRPVCLASFAVAFALAGSSCREPTQVTLSVTTNARCPTGAGGATGGDVLHSVAIFSASEVDEGKLAPTTITKACSPGDGANAIGTLVLLPGSDRDAVDVVVVAGVSRLGDASNTMSAEECAALLAEKPPAADAGKAAAPCIVARRRLSFVRGSRLTLPVELETACVGVLCDEDSTCADGSCVPAEVACEGGTCSTPGSDATTSTSMTSTSMSSAGIGGAGATTTGMGGATASGSGSSAASNGVATSSAEATTAGVGGNMPVGSASVGAGSSVGSSSAGGGPCPDHPPVASCGECTTVCQKANCSPLCADFPVLVCECNTM